MAPAVRVPVTRHFPTVVVKIGGMRAGVDFREGRMSRWDLGEGGYSSNGGRKHGEFGGEDG